MIQCSKKLMHSDCHKEPQYYASLNQLGINFFVFFLNASLFFLCGNPTGIY